MSTARSWHTATLLGNGRVVVVGGVDASRNVLNVVVVKKTRDESSWVTKCVFDASQTAKYQNKGDNSDGSGPISHNPSRKYQNESPKLSQQTSTNSRPWFCHRTIVSSSQYLLNVIVDSEEQRTDASAEPIHPSARAGSVNIDNPVKCVTWSVGHAYKTRRHLQHEPKTDRHDPWTSSKSFDTSRIQAYGNDIGKSVFAFLTMGRSSFGMLKDNAVEFG